MRIISRIYHFVVDGKIPTLSGSLCFFLLLNGGSYLFLFVSLSSRFFIDWKPFIEEGLKEGIIRDIFLYLIEHNANLSVSVFLLASSIYSSSTLYYHFMHICELITKQATDYRIGKRIQSLFLVPIVLLILFIGIGLLMVIHLYFDFLSYLFFLFLSVLFIYFLNKVALRGYKFKRLIKGIIFTFLYWIGFSLCFIVYLNLFSNFKVVYGFLSFIIILLFYLYILTIGVFLGIYMNCKNLEVSDFFSEPY